MGKLFERKLATSRDGQLNFRSHSFRRSREAKHGSPERGAPRFYARNFARTALQSIVLLLGIVISMMATVKLAQASGIVQPTVTVMVSDGSGNVPTNAIPLEAAKARQVDAWNTDLPYVGPCSDTTYKAGANPYPTAYGQFTYFTVNCAKNPYIIMIVYWVRPRSSCPPNSTGTPQINPTTCTCNDNYQPDATGKYCVPADTCPVDKLTTPPFDDACSTSLEQGKGVDVNNACGTLREPDMVEAASCIADKIHALNIPYTQPSATIRTTAYQNHLLEIWTKSQLLYTLMNSVVFTPEIKQACAPRNVDVNNEKAAHGITHQPSSSGYAAPHVEHRAIDIPEAVSDALMDQVTTYTYIDTIVNGKTKTTKTIASDVEDYMHSAPNACDPNLSWGGRFTPKDSVHFQLP